MNKPLVSIFLPCYNAEKYILECLKSIQQQTYSNIEVIIVDDGSKDRSIEIIEKFITTDSRFILVKNPINLGLIKTLNKHLPNLKGDYIARMDADDICAADRIQQQVEFLQNNPEVSVVSTGFTIIDDDANYLIDMSARACTNDSIKFISLLYNCMCHAAVMIRSTVYKSFEYDSNFLHCEDYKLFDEMICAGYKISNIKRPLYYVRKNVESVSHKYENIQVRNFIKISGVKINREFPDINLNNETHEIITNKLSQSYSQSQLVDALNTLKFMAKKYCNTTNCDEQTREEISHFLIEHKVDIIIQATIKYWRLSRIWLIFKNLPFLLQPRAFMFTMKKIRFFLTR